MAKTSKSDSKSKSKIAVSIKTHKKATTTGTQKSLAGKKVKAQNPKPKLAPGLPLSSDPVPSNSITSTRLTPGNILQKCSGSDIKITKNCDAKPNLAIGRGRFLFILPGLLSLKQPTQDADKTLSGSTLFTTGKIFGLDTKTPTMKIDLPSGAQMILKGKKISSTSRYLVLTCKTSGNIQCKNMFQEMVMFESCTLQGDVSDKKSASEEKEQQKFNHYGGSDRALDGGREVRGIKKKTKTKAIVRDDSITSDVNQSQVNQSQSQETGLEQSQTSISIEDSDDQGIGNDIIGIEEDSDDSDAVKFKLDSPVVPRSKSSRRSTSKKVNYSQEPEEEESSNDSSDNDSVDDEDEDHGIQSRTIKKTAKDPSERKKISRVDIELDSDSDSEVEEIVASPIKPRQRSSRRSSASKAINYSQESEPDDDIVSDDSEEEIDDNDNEDDTSDFEIEQDPKPKQKRAPAKKAAKDTDVKPSKSATKKGNTKAPRRTPSKTKTKTSPNKSSSSTKKKSEFTTKKKNASAVKKTSSTVNKDKDLDIADIKTSATKRSGPLSPSFRKRRKGSTPKKSPSRSLDVTLGDDEDFAFIE